LKDFDFSLRAFILIGLGGMCWILASLFYENLNSVVRIKSSDSNEFEQLAYNFIVPNLENGNYSAILQWIVRPGKKFYVTIQGILYYYTGATINSMSAINSFMAFWGSMRLARLIFSFSPTGIVIRRSTILLLFLVFAPSVVFWSCRNLKEGLMYWSICMIFSIIGAENYTREKNIESLFGFCFALLIGSLLRPFIIIFWVFSVLGVRIVGQKRVKGGIVLLSFTVLFIGITNTKFLRRGVDGNVRFIRTQTERIVQRGNAATFLSGKGKTVYFLSGVINVAFRPFPWRVRDLKTFLSCSEIWFISIGTIITWARMSRKKLLLSLRNPAVQVALIVCIPFFFIFSLMPNEGLIARQRIQMFPAFLVLFAMPLVRYGKTKLSVTRSLVG